VPEKVPDPSANLTKLRVVTEGKWTQSYHNIYYCNCKSESFDAMLFMVVC